MRSDAALINTSAENPRAEYTINIRRADGQLRQIRCLTRAIIGSDGAIEEFQMVAFDITDQRRFEERLSQTNKLETIGMLAGGIAHDFNNMLQTILGFGELALLETPPPDPRARTFRGHRRCQPCQAVDWATVGLQPQHPINHELTQP